MRLSSVRVRRMPGIALPFEIDGLGEGVVLVHGPNGSGKTTLCRAVRGLLWPDTLSTTPVSLEARLRAADDESWAVEREGSNVSWARDGEAVSAPVLPPSHLARCFTLGVEDLLVAADAREIADEIRRQMAGGFPLEALFEERALAARRSPRIAEAAAVRSAEIEVVGLRERQRELAQREATLTRLRDELKEARDRLGQRSLYEKSRDLARARAAAREAALVLARFPEDMQRLRGDEAQRRESLQVEREKAALRLAEAERDLADATRRLHQAGFDGGLVADADLRAWRHALDGIARDAQLADESAVAHEEAAARRAEALCVLGAPPPEGVALDDRDQRTVEEMLTRAERLAARKERLEADREVLAAAARGPEAEPLREAARTLRAWLAASPTLPIGALAAAALSFAAAGGAVAATFLGPVPFLGGIAAAMGTTAAGVLLLVIALRRRRPDAESTARTLAEAGVPLPESWDRDAVEERLDVIEAAVVKAERAEQARAALAEIEARSARLADEWAAWEAERDALAQKIAIPHRASSLALAEAARAIASYRNAGEAVVAAAARRDEISRRAQTALTKLAEALRAHARQPVLDVAAARATLDDLEQRHRLALAAENDRIDAERRRDHATDELQRLAERERTLYAEAGVAQGDTAELLRRLEMLPAFRAADERSRFESEKLREAQQAVGGAKPFDTLDIEQAEALLVDLDRDAENAERLVAEISAIESEAALVRGGRALESALDRLEAARAALAEKRDEAFVAAAGAALLDDVRERHDRVASPAVLAAARDYFARFTAERYELRVATEGPAALRAFDTVQERLLELDQLSAGTRTQLLLAARLAFAERAAGGSPLPLFLDEALGVSDDERFAAVAKAMADLVRDGWQVWYLTCQPADVALWRRELAALDPSLPVRDIDLAALRGLAAGAGEPVEVPRVEPVPDPGSFSAEEYGARLRVPRLDPHGPAGAVHLFYALADDLPLLARALTLGIDTLGPWERFSRGARASAYFSAREMARIDALVAATRALLAAWLVGRPRPLAREDLHAILREAKVNEIWHAGLASILEECEGDAQAFVERVEAGDERVKGFRSRILAKVREVLEESGHLDASPPLDFEILRQTALREAAPAVAAGALEPALVPALALRLWGCVGSAKAGEQAPH